MSHLVPVTSPPVPTISWNDWERTITAGDAKAYILGIYVTGKPVGSYGVSFMEPFLSACITSKLQQVSKTSHASIKIQNLQCSPQGVCCHFVADSPRARQIFKDEVRQELLLMFASIGRKISAGTPVYTILTELTQKEQQ